MGCFCVMLLACLELPQKFVAVVGGWVLKATLVFIFGPNQNVVLELGLGPS